MKKLSVYLMAGPDTPDLAAACVDAGADSLEIGFPFSDPLADGPVIRLAGERALAQGMRTKACLECLAEVRSRVDVPLVPMTYASLLEAYGYDRFWADSKAAGAASLIVADLPVDDESARSIPRVHLVAPTTPAERIALAAERTDGWLYLVSVTRTTGARTGVSTQLPDLSRASPVGHGRPAARRVRHLDTGGRRRSGRARRRRRRRQPSGRVGSRERPGRARRVRHIPPRGPRRALAGSGSAQCSSHAQRPTLGGDEPHPPPAFDGTGEARACL